MALTPTDNAHALQIQAGTLGRKSGHDFEDEITDKLNSLGKSFSPLDKIESHVMQGEPEILLLNYILKREKLGPLVHISALSTGALATSEEGKKLLSIEGNNISRCKSDLVITLEDEKKRVTVGVSTKQCNQKRPTNAQLYFTTAAGFTKLLKENGVPVSQKAENALRQFCGDIGFRPQDNPSLHDRVVDPRRFFWEEIDSKGRKEWETLFTDYQDEISRLLLQKAYLNDPYYPEYVLHKTKKSPEWSQTEVAIYTVEELIRLSKQYRQFYTKPYSINKGSYKDPKGIKHLAPRFGVIQMQRGGQKQHPSQLQFNLEASYFYKI